MNESTLEDAFGHHVWASLRVIDTCMALDADQLDASAPGTFGSIIDTIRHIVRADVSYLFALTGGRRVDIDESQMDLGELRAVIVENEREWASLLKQDLDPDAVVIRYRDDGSESHAPLGIRLAQAIHHGTDHRSQVCTVLTTIGIDPPAIDVWDFADQDGRLTEVNPS